jgi:T4 RnlA family RNA ligase
MRFPHLTCLADLLPHVAANPHIRVAADEATGVTVACYMLQDEDLFTGPHEAFERECRGVAFDTATGRLLARTLHKFHNVGETAATQPGLLPWDRAVRVMEKRDGSMVAPVLLPSGAVKFKTKKSLATKEAECADRWLAGAGPRAFAWVRGLLERGLTPTFEITSPRFPIVVLYERDELTLLHVRENESGRYLSVAELEALDPPMALVRDCLADFREHAAETGEPFCLWSELRAAAETVTGMEGWVVQFDDGEMVKVKTKWYIDLHHAVTFVRWRDLARAVADDRADDLRAAMATAGRDLSSLDHVQAKIHEAVASARAEAKALAAEATAAGKTAKDLALALRDHPLFGLVMREFRAQYVDYLEWYAKTRLDADWSLEVVPALGAGEPDEGAA